MSASRVLVAFVIAIMGLITEPAWAQPDLSKPQGPTLAELGAPGYTFAKHLFASHDGERHYRIYLAMPIAPAPPAGYPVIYMLDGNAAFEDLRAADLAPPTGPASPPVVVGIGYDTPLRFDVAARNFDYTPPVDAAAVTMIDARHPERKTGGAEAFLAFIEGTLKPFVERRIHIDRQRQAIYGHSYGGLFVLHTLFTRPQAFQTYIAVSPSLWWGEGVIAREEAAAKRREKGSTMRVLLMVGGSEQRRAGRGASPAPQAAQGTDTLEGLRTLTERLRRRGDVEAELRVFAGKGHGPMLSASVGPAVRFAVDGGAVPTK